LDPYKYPKKTFFEFFLRFLGTKGEKVVIFGFIGGTKDEFRIFEEQNLNFSVLVPAINPKITTFSPFVPVKSPQKSMKKIQKKFF
jgi:hypothetical protein